MPGGLFHIPLHTNGLAPVSSTDRVTSAGANLREYIGSEENALCRVAVESLFRESSAYNPLVFFGPLGTGKTFLARGLAVRWKEQSKTSRVLVTGGADFARDYRNAVETDSLADFRSKFRRAGLLVIDDLHELGEKSGAQIELTHTLDALVTRGHRVLVTMLQAPAECPALSNALASRLSSGLTVPLVAPGPAARRQILRRLAKLHQITLSEAVLDLIVQDNSDSLLLVPELDSALLLLAEASRQAGRPIDCDFARELLSTRNQGRRSMLRSITGLVGKYFNLRASELKGPTRQQRVVRARGVAMLLARQLTNESLEQVGRHFGNRDHTTVLHACRKTESLIQSDPAIRQAVEDLTLRLSTT